MFRLFDFLIFIFVCLSAGLSACLLGGWVLWPIERVARQQRVPWQFTLPDFFSLAFIVQLVAAPFAVVFQTPYEYQRRETIPLILLALVLVAIVWCTGVRTLSRAGVRHGGRRFVFSAFVLPLTFVTAPALGPLMILSAMILLEPFGGPDVAMFLGIDLGLVLGIGLAKAACRWVLSETTTEDQALPADAIASDRPPVLAATRTSEQS